MKNEISDSHINNIMLSLNKTIVDLLLRNRYLEDSCHQKDTLIKEMHHRVKNNLQIISDLLNLQVESSKDEPTLLALRESAARINAIALVHKILNISDNLKRVEMVDYVNNIFHYLYDIYKIDPNKVKYSLDIELIYLNIDKAVPCGLIINELFSNIFKHAFPGAKTGTIKVMLKLNEEDKIILTIHDDGVGIPMNIDVCNTATLGMQLIHNLTKQLNGKISLDRSNGTLFTVVFMRSSKENIS